MQRALTDKEWANELNRVIQHTSSETLRGLLPQPVMASYLTKSE